MKLVEVSEQNWLKVIFLSTSDKMPAICEEFVASNALSLVQAQFEPFWVTKVIEAEDALVGFTMYGFVPEDQQYVICRLMIDHKFQGKGYGRKAMELIIAELQKNEDCDAIYLSTEPHNEVAKKLYKSLGFKSTNRVVDGEEEFVYMQQHVGETTSI
ncbi:GNAT family N-acetyltransferase [Lysinibacillus odysseyi]|uniref:GNAT family N-acetyltransferase n=1 Tax=Lysinibacillus odysseyi TaxID=202611 RepID=UPI000AD2B55B|nr:GNAT family N-acetyltransferase [Lysinibacillus odysseyi]